MRRIAIRVLFGDALGDRADELGARLEPAMEYGVQPGWRQRPHPLPYTRRARARQALRDVLDTLLAQEGESISTTEVRDQTISLIAAEANEVFGATPPDDLDVAALRSLPFADAVVRESLRLHPPGVFSPRQAARDLTLGDYAIRKEAMIMWSPYVAGRRPDVWDEPLAFRPDRFVDPDERQQAAIDAAWMPFGKGPRACIGFALARMELTLAIARLAQRTDVALTRSRVPKPVGMIVNRPEGGVIARVSAAS